VLSAEVVTWCVGITMNSKQWWLMMRRLFFRCIQKNIKESIRRYAHLMHYSGPAATEQMLMDGSCWWQHWKLHPRGELHMLSSSLLACSLAKLVWSDLNPLPDQENCQRNCLIIQILRKVNTATTYLSFFQEFARVTWIITAKPRRACDITTADYCTKNYAKKWERPLRFSWNKRAKII
jgi:hypothetical protein